MAIAPASTPARTRAALAGWPIVAWSSALVAISAAAAWATAGGEALGWHAAIRLTARTSFVLFTAAFVASSLRVLWPTPATRWLLANRRYVGVSFAASHALHLLAIAALVRVDPDFRSSASTVIGGGIAYVFLAAMTATSSDRAVAWLGVRRWRLLHKSGMYYCWFIFFTSYAPRAAQGGVTTLTYAPFVAALLGSLILRAAARRR